jgi:FAD synthase
MDVLEWDDFIAQRQGNGEALAVAIGVFDGVHRGHQALLRRITSGPFLPVALTFRQNPLSVLRPHGYPGDISSLEQKLKILEFLGVRQAVLIDFSDKFSKIRGRDFINLLKRSGRVRYFALGRNFRCGYRLDTGVSEIREMTCSEGIETEALEPVMEGGRPVSSSRIRRELGAGNLDGAALLLGRKAGIDFFDVPVRNEGGCLSYNMVSAFRITPPEGAYKVLLYSGDSVSGREATISIKNGNILIPGTLVRGGFYPERIEFLNGTQGV